jgi:hypothetical protein
MARTACTEPQCLYSRAIPVLPLWAVRPVQSLSACKRVNFTFIYFTSFGILGKHTLYLVTDVSGDSISLIFTSQAILHNTPDKRKPYE